MKKYLLDNIEKVNGCWIWKRALNNKDINIGYGICYHLGKRKLAHRASYEVFKGEVPRDLFVCHTCDNRRCINPEHLWIGTRSDNAVDAVKKGRMKPVWGRKKTQEEIDKIQKNRTIPDQKGERSPRAKLSNQQVLEIREKLSRKVKYKYISEEYGIDICSLSDIKFRRTWKHI